ncbi:hypothetical protein G9O61_00g014230 [Vairimorpha ceranae]|nr:hypothetical protein G9O61_00g014230 [Vairimorpha ceranae]
MKFPDFSHLLYFTLGSTFTLCICTKCSYSLLFIISLSSLMFLFTDDSFLNLSDILYLFIIFIIEYFLSFISYMQLFNFYIFNTFFSLCMVSCTILYIINLDIFKYSRSTYLIYFIISGFLFSKCYFSLLFFINKLNNEYNCRIKNIYQNEKDSPCIIPFLE